MPENPRCPECQAELEDDFGIVDCNSCGAVCSVDLEGEVQIQGEVAESVEAVEEDLPLELEEEAAEALVEEPISEDSLEDNFSEQEEYGATAEEDPSEDLELSESETEDEKESDFLEPLSEDGGDLDIGSVAPMMGIDFLKDLETFTEENSAEELEHIYYDLSVSGFDSKADRDVLIETLSDQRLEISEEYLKELIGNESAFVLPQLSFLRLSVVYKRLLSLGLQMSWALSEEQQPRVQEEPFEEMGSEGEEYLDDDLI